MLVLRCVYCHGDLGRLATVFCAACLAPHHAGCQLEHGRCAAPGCGERDVVRRERVSRWRSSAFLAGLSGVALATAVVAGGLVVGDVLATDATSTDPAPAAPRAPVKEEDRFEVLLITRIITRSIFMRPGERLVFLGGPITGLEVMHVDARGHATSVLVLSPIEGIDVRVAAGTGSTWVPAKACPVVLGFDGSAVFGGTRHALASETSRREREESP